MKKFLFAVLLVMLPLICSAQDAGVHRIGVALSRGNGVQANIVPFASIQVCVAGTFCAELAPVFSDLALTQPLQQPVVADASGNYDYYFAAGCVDEQLSTPGKGNQTTYNVCLFAGGNGVTSAGLTMPSWLSVLNSPLTAGGTINVIPATGQTSGRVIGTCGSSTSFAPCALVPSDIPTLNQNTTGSAGSVPFSGLTGTNPFVQLSPTTNQTITQSVNTSFNVNTSGTGALKSNGNPVLTTVTGTPTGTAVLYAPTGPQNISQPGTTSLSVSNLNGVISPMVCGSSAPPSWCSGTDPGAWINQAYAQLPTGSTTIGNVGGGEIDIPSGNWTIAAPIVFGTLGKPALLKCAPGTSFTWATPNTTGTMVTLDWGWSGSGLVNIQTPQGGIDGCQFFGNQGTSTGLLMALNNGGSVGAHIEDTMFYNFGTGIHFPNTTLPPFLTTITNSFFNTSSVAGMVVDSGSENIHMFGGDISNNPGGIGLQVNNNSADVYLFGVSFDSDGIQVNGGFVDVYSCHFENPSFLVPHYIQTTNAAAFVRIRGGTMLDDRTGATGDYFINLAPGSFFEMDTVNTFQAAGSTLTSLITSTGIPTLNLTNISAPSGGTIFHNTAGTQAGEISTSFATGLRAINLPITVGFGTTVTNITESNVGVLTFNNNGHSYFFDNAGNIIAPTGGGFAVGSTLGVTKTCTTFPITVVGGIITGC